MERSDLEIFDDDADRYFKGQMSETEEKAFMAMVEAHPELKSRLTVIALMKKSMHDIRLDETRHIDAEITQIGEEEYRKRTSRSRSLRLNRAAGRYIRYAAAACIIGIIALSAWLILRPNPYKALGERCDYYAYNTDIAEWSIRGDEDLAPEEIDSLLLLFANVAQGSDLDATTEKLHNALADATAHDSDLTDAIAWNLAIAYLKCGNGARAREVLEEMLERNRGLYPETEAAVSGLIEQIDSIEH